MNAVKAVEQANVISGTVVDETGEPVIGANVLVKGTTNGQITDLNGGFSIKVEHASATLLVSYVGYVRQEVKATSGKILKIVLVPDANMMEEVVVTGYGTFKKSAYAGSAASVKNEKIADVPSVSFRICCGKCYGCTVYFCFRPAGFFSFFEYSWYGLFQCLQLSAVCY